MRLLDKILSGRYWIVYYLTYLVSFPLLTWYYRTKLRWPGAEPDVEQLYMQAALFAVSAGFATLVAVFFEVTGRMVLLIPAAWRKAKAEGHAEGLAEGHEKGLSEGHETGLAEGHEAGLAEGLQTEHNRVRSILAEQGQRDPATGAITLSPETAARLLNGAGEP